MAPKIEHDYFEKSGILLRTFTGDISIDFLLDTWKEDLASGVVSADLKGVISDLSSSDLTFDLKDLRTIQAFYKQEVKVFGKIKMAQVVDTPDIVYPKIFEKEESEFNTRGFSTLKAAFAWVAS